MNLLSAEGLSAVFAILAVVLSIPAPAAAQERTAPAGRRPRVALYQAGEPVQRKVLKNGVTLLVQEQRTGDKVAGAVAVRMGTLYETDDEAGLSGVLAKTLAVGTTRQRPVELALQLLAIDAQLESGAGPDFGHLTLTTRREKASNAVALLAEIVTSPSFPDTAVESARQEALRRAAEQNDAPIAATYTLFLKGMYAGSPFARPVAGTVPALASCRRSDIVALHRKWFVGGNMVVAFVGNFDGRKLMADLEKAFAAVPSGGPATPAGDTSRTLEADTLLTETREFPLQSHAFGYPAPGLGAPDYPAFLILQSYLSAADRSPLAYWLPARRQATGVGVIYAPYPKRASLTVYMAGTRAQMPAARDSVKAVLGRLTTEPLDEGEWGVHLERVHRSYFTTQGDPKWRASQFAYLETIGLGHDYPKRFDQEILKLTPEDVRAAAARWFTHSCEASLLPRDP